MDQEHPCQPLKHLSLAHNSLNMLNPLNLASFRCRSLLPLISLSLFISLAHIPLISLSFSLSLISARVMPKSPRPLSIYNIVALAFSQKNLYDALSVRRLVGWLVKRPCLAKSQERSLNSWSRIWTENILSFYPGEAFPPDFLLNKAVQPTNHPKDRHRVHATKIVSPSLIVNLPPHLQKILRESTRVSAWNSPRMLPDIGGSLRRFILKPAPSLGGLSVFYLG